MDIDWTGMRNYIAQYSPAKLELVGEVKQKCFMVTADGHCGPYGYQVRTYCVFPTFIVSYVTGNGSSGRSYDIECHTLTTYALRSLKLSKLCYYKDDMISKVLSRFQILQQEADRIQWKVQKAIEKERKSLEKQLQKVEAEGYVYREEKKKFDSERQAFEKEKRELELELAKYKGIVLNCQKEIQAYGL
jgi:hypothetical protein